MWFGRRRRLLEIRRTWGEVHRARAATRHDCGLPCRTVRRARHPCARRSRPGPTSIWTTCSWRSIGRRARSGSMPSITGCARRRSGDHLEEFETLVERMRARRRRPRARAARALPVAGSARLRRLVARRGGRPRAAALVQPLPASDGGHRGARCGGAVLVRRDRRRWWHGGGQHGRSVCHRRTDHRDCPQLPAARPADRDGRIAAVPRRCRTSRRSPVLFAATCRRWPAEADLAMGQRQPVHVVVQLERARARARRSRRDRLRVSEHCLPAGCDRRSRRPAGSGGAPARAAARCGGGRRGRRRDQRCVVPGGRPDVDPAAVRRARLLRQLDDVVHPLLAGRRAELDRPALGPGRAGDRFQHVGQVDVPAHGRRQRRPRADDQYLPGGALTRRRCSSSAAASAGPTISSAARATTSRKSRRCWDWSRRAKPTDCCLFLLDEMFRGTNAVERIAAGEAVLRELLLESAGPRQAACRARRHARRRARRSAQRHVRRLALRRFNRSRTASSSTTGCGRARRRAGTPSPCCA